MVTPITSALSESRGPRAKLKDMMDLCFIDSILIAGESGRILYCDDERLRALGKEENNIEGVWTQALLAVALDEGLIDEALYSNDVIRLLTFNYSHIYVNPGIFLAAARKVEWRPVHPFLAVISVLSGAKSDLASAVTVATEVVYGIWNEPIMDHQRSLLVTAVLDSLNIGRNRAVMISVLLPLLKRRFYILPLHYEQVRQLIASWVSTHLM